MPKYKFSVGTFHAGSNITEEVEISNEDLKKSGVKTKEEIEDYIMIIFREWVWDNIDAYFERI